MINHYSLLNIPPDAEQAVIESAFKKFREEIARYGAGIELNDEEIRGQFPDICAAYATLLDPAGRKIYDDSLKNDRLPATLKENVVEDQEEIGETSLRTRFGAAASYIGFGLLVLGILYAFSQLFIL
jgi:DnaJ-class molecular chaperone